MKVLTMAANFLLDGALALLYPQSCAVCGASVESRADGVACAGCWERSSVYTESEPVCWRCGVSCPTRQANPQQEALHCGGCEPALFTAARACGIYEGALRASVLALKRQPHVAARLARLMADTLGRAPLDRASLIIPVPLHPARQQERGFNQAAVLARELSRRHAVPVDEITLIRLVHTERHRAGLDAPARIKSVARAFAVRYPRLIAGERVLLVDDVFTTGATVSSCGRELFAAGAAEVLVLTVARAPGVSQRLQQFDR